jgi:hypothetical protein
MLTRIGQIKHLNSISSAQSRKSLISFASKVHHRRGEIEFILTTRFRYATPDQKFYGMQLLVACFYRCCRSIVPHRSTSIQGFLR